MEILIMQFVFVASGNSISVVFYDWWNDGFIFISNDFVNLYHISFKSSVF